MLVELVRAVTSDGIRLDGAFHVSPPASSSPCDVVLLLHGVAGNFYGSTLIEDVTPAVLDAGVSVLRVNTRGHDAMYTAYTAAGPRPLGAAFEIVDQSRLDIAAWLDFLCQRGFRRIALAGHSLGAVKAVYWRAKESDHPLAEAVTALIAISPPRLSYRAFRHDPNSHHFQEALEAAQRAVDAGNPDELLQVPFPFPLRITAAGYLDKYGPDERYNIIPLVPRLTPPALFVYGQREVDSGATAFSGVPEAIRTAAREGQTLQVQVLVDADHVYTGCRDALAQAVVKWLDVAPTVNRPAGTARPAPSPPNDSGH